MMFRKISLVMFIIALFMTFGIASYADETVSNDTVFTDQEVADAIEIIAPVVKADDSVSIEKDNLYLNIRLNQPVEVYLNLYRVDSVIFTSAPVESNAVEAEDEEALILETTSDETDEPAAVEAIEEIPEILSAQDKIDFRKSIIDRYNQATKAVADKKAEVEAQLQLMKETFVETAIDANEAFLTPEQIQVRTTYRRLMDELRALKKALEHAEDQYNQLFEKLIFGPEEVRVSPIIPQYTNEIEDIDPGQYKMVFFRDQETQKAIKVVDFTIKSSKETVEKIVDTIPEDLNRIWEIKIP